MKPIKLTQEFIAAKRDWPHWLQSAWERDWGAPGGFEPSKEVPGEYIAHHMTGGSVRILVGDFISPATFA